MAVRGSTWSSEWRRLWDGSGLQGYGRMGSNPIRAYIESAPVATSLSARKRCLSSTWWYKVHATTLIGNPKQDKVLLV